MAAERSEETPLGKVRGLFKTAASGVTSVIAPSRAQRSTAAQLSDQLKQLLLQGLETKDFDRAAIDPLIAQVASIGCCVDPLLVSTGPWQAVYTKNSQPLWEKQAKYIPFVKNRSWQDYDLAEGKVKNVGQVQSSVPFLSVKLTLRLSIPLSLSVKLMLRFSILLCALQILGEAVFVEVQGAVSEQSPSDRTPKYYNADISSGTLNILGAQVPLPIKGKGVAKLLYQDVNLRVFESPKDSESEWEQEGLIVVQMPIDTVP